MRAKPGQTLLKNNALPGLYIHTPFCRAKCAYCDFYSVADSALIPAWINALEREMKLYSGAGNWQASFDTLYLGGGTPSILEAGQIGRIIALAFEHFSFADDAVVYAEANPCSADFEKLSAMRRAGVSRLHIGVQSFDENNLRFLGRSHTASQARQSLNAARQAGFGYLGADLIFGLPGQAQKAWQADLEEMLSYKPEHLSCYLLSYEHGTPLEQRLSVGEFAPLPQARAASLFAFTHDFLTRSGYIHYEISNYAPSKELVSRHNTKYWNRSPYLGLGPGAHSFYKERRWWNLADIKGYVAALEKGEKPVAESENLSVEQRAMEKIYLGLRQSAGLDLAAVGEIVNADCQKAWRNALQVLKAKGFVSGPKGRVALTPLGMARLDSIAGLLIQNLPL
jgi:oxygen-independent coproporphyrinogen-3 oxidase